MGTFVFPEVDNQEPVLAHEPPLLNQLLRARGLNSVIEAEAFVKPDYDSQLHSPLLLHDMEVACGRVETAIKNKERIAIFSDYDCDGIPGAVVLHDFFIAIAHQEFQNYIPHRHYEGFGLSDKAIDSLAADGVKLIITIDCGTSNVSEVAYARSKGIDVIITDHHEPEAVLPNAIAVVNPKLGEYPFADLCGAAVAFKLAQALLERGSFAIAPGWEKWWLDMVGVATIADMVPLVGENRVFACYGLQVLRKSRRPGLQQLLKKAKASQLHLTEDDIGFTIGPRINAASRMDSPEDAFYMLSETDLVKASERVNHLEDLNTQRKSMVAQMTKELHKRLKQVEEIPKVLVFGSPDWRPSLVGLAANKLAEEYNRPAFIWGTDGNGIYKGSCRSGGDASVVTLMQAVPDIFLEYGGHHVAGGFSVKDEYIFTFAEKLNTAMEELGNKVTVAEPTLIDAEISLNEVNPFLIKQLNQLAPFGMGNKKPLFAFKDATATSVEVFGKTKEHTKIIFGTENGQLEAIAFFQLPEGFTKTPKVDVPHTLIGHVEQSFFMGRQQIRVRIIDIL
jgi:single-stranded-DNA-specific exonuclease